MKINGNSIAGKIQEVAQAVTSNSKEVAKEVGKSSQNMTGKIEMSMRSVAEDSIDKLQLLGDANRAKLEETLQKAKQDKQNAVSDINAKLQPGGSVAGNVLYGSREGFDAGKKSGEQAHTDTHATGPKFIAGMAGGIVGGISGAIDGYNVGNSGGSTEDIRKEARANADYSGGIAGSHAMFLDETPGERADYPRYKQYQANGGKMSYEEWNAEFGAHYSGGGTNGTIIVGVNKEAEPQPAPTEEESTTTTQPSGDGNDEAWDQLAEYSGANDSEYIRDANSSEDPLTQVGNYSETGHNN
jgi:hypothetical protein